MYFSFHCGFKVYLLKQEQIAEIMTKYTLDKLLHSLSRQLNNSHIQVYWWPSPFSSVCCLSLTLSVIHHLILVFGSG